MIPYTPHGIVHITATLGDMISRAVVMSHALLMIIHRNNAPRDMVSGAAMMSYTS